ncbi:ABC transporter ATP-binding protein [Acidithiobacillus ferriphilus]|uniref:ABC transporter ATP-binding protein n=1 Tax=Acidithiobacillus ferriphilus TaxID=1689834 RepID=UPI00232E7A89|nr:ABC transporter ATP-binding protein [Acidithiobacillus ferriphilus]WCE93924.1 ABC transporter ATP-binding protein [Acidithiobacillus ferriphilus]
MGTLKDPDNLSMALRAAAHPKCASIILESVSMDLPIYDVSGQSLKKRVLRMGRRSHIAEDNSGVVVIPALREISLQLKAGDRLGLIGHNGAGKSTLLRVLAGIYAPSKGSIQICGKAIPLLDIGLGMDEQSNGWQNIRLRGLLLGMTDSEIRRKLPEIAEFTGLGDALDLPIRTYSNGMRLRLAFSISTAVDAEILILDEVLGVGDQEFQARAEERLRSLHQRAEIVVLAMHANQTIRDTCNKVMWLDHGQIRMLGRTSEVLTKYENSGICSH